MGTTGGNAIYSQHGESWSAIGDEMREAKNYRKTKDGKKTSWNRSIALFTYF